MEDARGGISATGMICVSEKDESITRIQLCRNGFMFFGTPLRTPSVRTSDDHSSTILFRGLGQRCNTAQECGEVDIPSVQVTISCQFAFRPRKHKNDKVKSLDTSFRAPSDYGT